MQKLYRRNNERGEAMTIITIVLVVALLGALGFIAWQNFGKKDQPREESAVSKENKQDVEPEEAEQKISKDEVSYTYIDLRDNKQDGTGVRIEKASDVDSKLSGIGSKLQKYLQDRAGQSVAWNDGKQHTQVLVIDRVYGEYATGTTEPGSAYEIWGPKNGNGAIDHVAGTQNLGFQLDKLLAAKVPKELVDSRAVKAGEIISYTSY